MTATADLPNKNIKNFTEKFSFAAGDKSIIIDSEDGDKIKLIAKTLMKGDTGAKAVSVAFVGDDMVFTLDDSSTVTLTDAKTDLKGDQGIQGNPGADGTDGATITSAAFVGNNLVFTLDDASTVTITNAKIELKGDTGENGTDGISFTPRGEYNAETTYVANDVVSYLGSSWIALQNTTGNTPSEGAYWTLNAAKGADGAGAGDIMGPATNTDSYIPQRDGTNSKTLKNGLAVPDGGLAGLTALGGKQDTLVSGTNIKSINGQSILGSGDITITGGGAYNPVLAQVFM